MGVCFALFLLFFPVAEATIGQSANAICIRRTVDRLGHTVLQGIEFFSRPITEKEIKLGETIYRLSKQNPSIATLSDRVFQRIDSDYLSRAFKALKSITEEERKSLMAYTMRGGEAINHKLRAQSPLDDFHWDVLRGLDSVLDKLPSYDGIVLRGANLTSETIGAFTPGTIVRDRGYLSCSPDRGSYYLRQTVNFVIRSKTGKEISYLSAFPDSGGEVLFKPNTKFVVLRVAKKDGKVTIVMSELNQRAH